MYQKVALLLCGIWLLFLLGGCGPGRLIFWPLYSATYKGEGFVAHVCESKGFASEFHDTITEFIVTCRD